MRVDGGGRPGWRAGLTLPGRWRRAPPPVADPPPPPPDGALVAFARDGAPALPVIVAAVQGLGPAELEAVVGGAAAGASRAGVRPLFLTDRDDLAPFRRARALVERLPPLDDLERLAPADEALTYLARRLALLCRKWRPLRVVAYGEPAAAWLAAVGRAPGAEALRPLLGDEPAEGHPAPRLRATPQPSRSAKSP